MVLVTSLWLATRCGAGAALGVVLVVLVVSLVFGATTIADSTLWIVGVLAWPLTATSAPRIAGVLTVTMVVCVLAGAAWSAALRRAARS
ncbi:hypothetical protein [Mobilicoccus caccae]|nr:hypothetical protein [Mobilicoccus caccae]